MYEEQNEAAKQRMDEERRFSRLYTRLVSLLDPDPSRSEDALRVIRRACSEAEGPGNSPGRQHLPPQGSISQRNVAFSNAL